MRRLITLLFVVFPLLASAQTFSSATKEHFTFKGISITGSVDSFARQLQKQGYSLLELEPQGASLVGKFANEYDCTIGVLGTEKSHIVYMIAVQFPEKNTWSSLKGQYSDLKEALTLKYGEPTSCVETFDSPYYEGDNYEMQALSLEKCRYTSLFMSDYGNVMLTISDSKCVTLLYVDNEGHGIHLEEARSAVMDDL